MTQLTNQPLVSRQVSMRLDQENKLKTNQQLYGKVSVHQSTVLGAVPPCYATKIIKVAKDRGIKLDYTDFLE